MSLDQKPKLRQFNDKVPVGTKVAVWRDNGECLITKTISPATFTLSGEAVVKVQGIAGVYAISHVRPVTYLPGLE